MTYVSFTTVDAITGIPANVQPTRGGPVDPAGCVRDFALETRWPITGSNYDILYGTTTGRTDIPGILSTLTKTQFDAAKAAEMAARVLALRLTMSPMVDAERDRRIDAGFLFGGTLFQARPADRENILGAASLAHMAVTLSGKKPGDLRWHDGDEDFRWIAADNSLVPMDAPTVIAFGQAAANHKSVHTFAARALKDADPIPTNFVDDGYWPTQ
ncbi:DUF4376 domain-containing protein [Aureimonas jatrophae]|uniref:DUF4376 domain-containing protein n=1 Tax=Aureimonas jatrophae TaxID=1166073 RepID=A0A1H0H080_9HYPH|nr:DUF4376 domain-containing protein [Aureimonas jatrophae]MBB3949900.1 hypothetical protein [Aureimonas jatrophae]SDO12444.1 protein of unknown function [Aureimonas jatrophae]